MTSIMPTSYEDRLSEIVKKLSDPKSTANIDSLLDCLNAIVFEINGKSPESSKKFESLLSRKFVQKMRINRNDFTTIKVLGKGAFGEVILVRSNATNEIYALKTMNKLEMVKRDEALCLWEEREIMALSNSEWIVKMFYAFQDNMNIYMVMEFVQGGDMVNFMNSYDVDEEMAKFYIAELSLALNHLHSIDNMLVDRGGHIKLCDFGSCIRMDKNGKVTCSVAVGTPDYISPEILASQSNKTSYGKECDWWSVGVFLYEFLIGETPFYAESLVGTYNRILNFKKSLKFPDDCELSKEAESIIKAFLTSSESRLGGKGIDDIKKHPFFKDVSWTWDTIRKDVSPVVPEFSSLLDTSCFDDQSEVKSIRAPQNPSSIFGGDHFPFIGFSFSNGFTFENQPSTPQTPVKKKTTEPSDSGSLCTACQPKIKELDKLIFEKETQIIKLTESLHLQESQCSQLIKTMELNNYEKSFKSAQEECVRLEQKIKALESDVLDATQSAKKIEAQFKVSKISEQETKIRYDDLILKNKTLEETIDKARISRQTLESQVDKMAADIEDSKNHLSQLMHVYSQVNTEFNAQKKEIESLSHTFNCTSFNELIETLKRIKFEREQLQATVNSYEKTIANYDELLKKQHSVENAEYVELNRKYNQLLTEQAASKARLDDMNRICKDLSDKADDKIKQIRDLTNENVNISAKLNELTFKYTALTLSENRLTRDNGELLERIREAETNIEQMTAAVRASDSHAVEVQEQLTHVELKIETYEAQIEKLKQQLEQQTMSFDQVQIKFDQLISKNTEMSSLLEDKESIIQSLEMNIRQLEAKVAINIIDLEVNQSAENSPSSRKSFEDVSQLKDQITVLKFQNETIKRDTEKAIQTERLLKEQAIKKLNEVALTFPNHVKNSTIGPQRKNQNRPDRKMDQQFKQLQMDFIKENSKHADEVKKYETRISEMNSKIIELQQIIESYQKEKANEMSSIPNFGGRISQYNFHDLINLGNDQIFKDGILEIPSKHSKNSRKMNWTKVRATLSASKLTIYKDTEALDDNILYLIKIELMCYVRAITQNDLIRCPPNDIAKIFQVIYCDDSSESEPKAGDIGGEKCTIVNNHYLINIQYHMPSTCDVCGKGLWGFIKSSFAMECRNCHFRCHKEHVSDPKMIPVCRDYDKRRLAKELLFMASSHKEQQSWIDVLLNLMKSTVGNFHSRGQLSKTDSKERTQSTVD